MAQFLHDFNILNRKQLILLHDGNLNQIWSIVWKKISTVAKYLSDANVTIQLLIVGKYLLNNIFQQELRCCLLNI